MTLHLNILCDYALVGKIQLLPFKFQYGKEFEKRKLCSKLEQMQINR